MWDKENSKLKLAADMVELVMPVLADKHVVLPFDSWYAKKAVTKLVDGYDNLDIVCNTRVDSVMHDLAPAKTGKRGRPAKRGKKLTVSDVVLSSEKIGDYYVGVRTVLCNLFDGREVLAYVTTPKKEPGTKRRFFSTLSPYHPSLFCAWHEDELLSKTGSDWMKYIPLFLYIFRWKIEVEHYEQKTFWSLCGYMVRSKKGIETLVNLVNITYGAMKILPYLDESFHEYEGSSPQEFRYALSEQIREQVFFDSFVNSLERGKKSSAIIHILKQWVTRHYASG